VSLSVVQWSESAGEQCVLCTVITRMLLDHIRIIVHMDIILSYCFILLFPFVHSVCNFVLLCL
jgi:hypothetical protein